MVAVAAALLAGSALALVLGGPIARLYGASASIATLGFLLILCSVLAAARDFTPGNQVFFGIPCVTGI